MAAAILEAADSLQALYARDSWTHSPAMTERHDVTAGLPTVSVPVPVVAGADDRIVPRPASPSGSPWINTAGWPRLRMSTWRDTRRTVTLVMPMQKAQQKAHWRSSLGGRFNLAPLPRDNQGANGVLSASGQYHDTDTYCAISLPGEDSSWLFHTVCGECR
jgi:hypothetical protein